MENIKIEIGEETLKEGINKAIESIFSSSYSNPLKDVLEKALKEKEGVMKEFVDGILQNVLTNAEFKEKISNTVISSLVQKALKGN